MKKEVAFLFVLILSVSFIFAFGAGNIGNPSNSLVKTYAPNGTLSGWINISLNSESANTNFTGTKLKGSIKLIDLIELNSNLGVSCVPTNCEDGYA